ncbi:DUF1801 domain-containing protein [Reinekea marina]|uniref:DUF1801 domain-containing protein n=1 Tax=Reinekea marina TaxID=1310421 RepID=A0ABV7WRC6_9GAMM|nr:DUF1801 domain-containing protein [Reinekea marina]MDN3647744.1 DUF1801 domain-containing protein [Reinekea marina]
MAKYTLKTQPTTKSIETYLSAIEDESRQADCRKIVEIMREESGCEPVMWGAIVGFGKYHYKYKTGHEGDFMRAGFSSRKTNISLYIMAGFDAYPDLMSKLGKFKTGKSCLYVKKLDDVDIDVLRRLIRESLDFMEKTYGPEESH